VELRRISQRRGAKERRFVAPQSGPRPTLERRDVKDCFARPATVIFWECDQKRTFLVFR
jgi:hypothetical protein